MPVILGPTGIGKSDVAFRLARAVNGEVVVCDSRQVYRRLDIASNKPPPERMAEVRYHMVGIAEPTTAFNAFEYVAGANRAITDIAQRGRLPVVEGGSSLWADALMDGFSLSGIPAQPERRSELERMSVSELTCLLDRLDPEAVVDRRNPVRLVRAIEVLEVAGPPLARLRGRTPPRWKPIRIGLTADMQILDRRLRERSFAQVARGLIDETQAALAGGVPEDAPALTGIGYVEAVEYLRGELTEEELPEVMARSNRRYARRQLRWLRRDPRVTWFAADDDPLPSILGFLKEKLK